MLVGQGDERQVRPLRVSMRRLRPFEPPELGIPRVVDEPIGESRGGLSDRGFGAAARHTPINSSSSTHLAGATKTGSGRWSSSARRPVAPLLVGS